MSVWKFFQKLIHLNPIKGRNSTAVGESEVCLQFSGSERHKETPDVLDGLRFSNIFHEEMMDKPTKERLGRW